MKNLKVSVKLILSFLIVLVVAIIVGVVGIVGMTQINTGAIELYERQTVPLVDLAYAREYFQRLRSEQRNLVISYIDRPWIDTIVSSINYQENDLRGRMESFSATIVDPNVRAAYNEAMEGFNSYMRAMDEIIDAARAGVDQPTLLAMMRAATPYAVIAGDGMAEMMYGRVEQAQDVYSSNQAAYRTILTIIIVALAVAIAAALFLAFYLSSLIGKPLTYMSKAFTQLGMEGSLDFDEGIQKSAQECAAWQDEIGQAARAFGALVQHLSGVEGNLTQMAQGDFSIDVSVLSEKDNIGMSLDNLLDSLNNMFGEINTATSQVSAGSKQIADGAQTLAQGSTEQAASVQQLSSSIADIEQKTKGNASMAEKAAMLANDIKGSAEKGNRQMDEMMTAVKDINESSQNISKVIKSIDDIAFQTNILALNAAVEAARAGQHGKGFAVVAEEVRNLAAKSAAAAKDTESLIADSIEKAELGSKIADETAASLVEIVSGIDESSRLVSDIARSSEEQSAGITQINTGVDQVAQVVQQNSATAEQSAAASQEMSGQSDILETLVARFKLKDSGGVERISAPTTPAAKSLPAPAKAEFDDGFGKY